MAVFAVKQTDKEGFALPWAEARVSFLKKTVDFSVVANNLVTTGVMSIFKLPAKCIVLACGIKVLTADAQISDVDLGLYTEAANGDITAVDIDGYGDGLNLTATGYKKDPDAAFNSAGAEAMHVVVADSFFTIKVITNATLNDAVVEFYAVVMDVS